VRRLQLGLVRWFSRRVGKAKRERLERAMRAPRRRRLLLWLLFRAMPRAIRRKALERERAVIEWRVTGRPDDRHDVRQLVIEEGAAELISGEPREADLILTIDGVDLLLLATGNASGAKLFVEGQVEIDGDPWLAMRLPRIFGAPQ
jgi:predicted lipid carrier protein YhbT